MQHEEPKRIDRLRVLEIAGKAGADPRSVAKALRGQPVKGLVGDRIRRAIEQSPEASPR